MESPANTIKSINAKITRYGISKAELAREANITREYCSAILNYRQPGVSARRLFAMCEAIRRIREARIEVRRQRISQ